MNIRFRKAFFLTLTAAFAWAVSIVLTRFILTAGENPYTLVFWTELLSLPIWLSFLFRHKYEARKLEIKSLCILFIIGFGQAIGISLIEIFALKYTTAVNFAFLIRSIVLFTILFSALAFHEKITIKKLTLALLIIAGGFLLTTKGKGVSFHLGDILTLIEAAVIAFVNNILVKVTVAKMHPDLSAAGSFFFGLLFIIIFSFFNHAIQLPINFIIIILLVICSILLAQTRNRAYKIASASFVTMIMSLTPVMVYVISLIFLHEKLDAIQLVGGLLIISTGFLAEKFKI